MGSQTTYVLVLAFCASEDRLQVIISIVQFLLQLCHLRTERSITKRQHAGSKTLDSTQQGCFCMPSGCVVELQIVQIFASCRKGHVAS